MWGSLNRPDRDFGRDPTDSYDTLRHDNGLLEVQARRCTSIQIPRSSPLWQCKVAGGIEVKHAPRSALSSTLFEHPPKEDISSRTTWTPEALLTRALGLGVHIGPREECGETQNPRCTTEDCAPRRTGPLVVGITNPLHEIFHRGQVADALC